MESRAEPHTLLARDLAEQVEGFRGELATIVFHVPLGGDCNKSPEREEDVAPLESLNGLAFSWSPLLLECAESMSALPIFLTDSDPDGTLRAAVQHTLQSFGEMPGGQLGLSCEIARQMIAQLPASTERAAALMRHVLDRSLSRRASEYISRATRLHIWGFEPECLIMCRSVLESALADALGEHDDRALSLSQLIRTARDQGRLSPSLVKAARQLQFAGNRAVHEAPAFLERGIANSAEAISHLAAILSALFPSLPGEPILHEEA